MAQPGSKKIASVGDVRDKGNRVTKNSGTIKQSKRVPSAMSTSAIEHRPHTHGGTTKTPGSTKSTVPHAGKGGQLTYKAKSGSGIVRGR